MNKAGLALLLTLGLSGFAFSSDDSEDLVRRFMDGMHTGNFDVVDDVMCPNLVFRLNGTELNRTELRHHIEDAYQAYPDFHHGIEELASFSDTVVLRARNTATDPETGQKIISGQITMYEVVGGCIRRAWEEFALWPEGASE